MAGSWESQTEEYTNPGTGPNQRNILIKRANTDAESKIKPSPDLYTLFRRGVVTKENVFRLTSTYISAVAERLPPSRTYFRTT